VSHADLPPSVLWRNRQTEVWLVLRPKPRNRRGDFEAQTRAAGFEVKPGETVTTNFEAKLEKTIATGFEAKPEKTVTAGFEAKPLETIQKVLRPNH
jgi:hypothetical protein